MPHRSSGNQEPTPPVTLRRSPRFLQIVLSDPQDPKTPDPNQHRRTRSHSSATPLSLTRKTKVSPQKKTHRSKSKVDGSCNGRQRSVDSKRLNRCVDGCDLDRRNRGLEKRVTRGSCRDLDANVEKAECGGFSRNTRHGCSSGELILEEDVNISKQLKGGLEKRVTRGSCRDLDANVEKAECGGFSRNTRHGCSSGELILEEDVNISKQLKGKSSKNKVKHSKKKCDHKSHQSDTLVCDDKISEGVLSIAGNQVLDEELSKMDGDEFKNRDALTTALVVQEGPINMRDANKKQKNIGVKRTRNQFENTMGITQGWTKDQELALERAYLEAKPTPHFWKKVSRLVPGKTAQECFDKIHGSHLTPPQPRVRCKARVSNPQNPLFSASKLLNTSSPTTKRPRYRKQKSHIVHRTVRHMLQNQYKVGQDSESDMFSLLEPTFSPSLNLNLMLTTPDRNKETDDAQKRSLTAHRSASRFGSSHVNALVSPPVLKQVKNKALHEKYIDLLNCREANRKAASVKAEKLNKSEVMKQENSAERKEAIKAAKNALVFGAKDAINEFQHQQATALNDLFDYDSGADADEDND